MQTIAESLQRAADSLTEENWRKGSYFAEDDGLVCMCVHGAVQAQVNPEVAKALAWQRTTFASAAAVAARSTLSVAASAQAVSAAATQAAAAGAVASTAAAAEAAAPTTEATTTTATAAGPFFGLVHTDGAAIYAKRPTWVSGSSRGLDAHYVMGMVGLTAPYNDSKETTLPDVLAKLKQASELAKELGV